MIKKKLQPWEKSERGVCDFFGMDHVGGPGKEDCVDKNNPNHIAEIKDYNRSFNAYDLKLIIKKKWTLGKNLDINVINDCTKNAEVLAKKLPHVNLRCNLRKELYKKEIHRLSDNEF